MEESTDQKLKRKRDIAELQKGPDLLSLMEFPRYESLPSSPSEKSSSTPNEALSPILDSTPGSKNPNQVSENLEIRDFQCKSWDEPIVIKLEDLLLSNIYTILTNAIKKICARKYGENEAKDAIGRVNVQLISKDLEACIVDDALEILKKIDLGDYKEDSPAVDLQHLAKYIMYGLIFVLMECKGSLNLVETMWALLVCDLNIYRAYNLEEESLNENCHKVGPVLETEPQSSDAILLKSDKPDVQTCPTANTQIKSNAPISEKNISQPKQPRTLKSLLKNVQSSASDKITFRSTPNIKNQKIRVLDMKISKKEFLISASCGSGKLSGGALSGQFQTTFETSDLEEKNDGGGRKGLSKISIKQSKLWQRASPAEKHYLAARFSGVAKNGKLTTYSAIVSERIQNNSNLPLQDTASAPPTPKIKPSPSVPIEKETVPKPEANIVESDKVPDYLAGIPYDEITRKYSPQNAKDVIILTLVQQLNVKKKELEGWSDSANKKVMQATNMLSKDKAELKTLREEKEELEKVNKEKQALEESAKKRLVEMEGALKNVVAQVEEAKLKIVKLEEENLVMKKMWEVAVLQSQRAEKQNYALLEREEEMLMKVQEVAGQKEVVMNALTYEKVKVADLQQKVEKAKVICYQTEAELEEERNASRKILMEAASIIEENRLLKVLVREKVKGIRHNVTSQCRQYEEDGEELEEELSEMRLKPEASKVAALRRGMAVSTGIVLNLKCTLPQNFNRRLPIFEELTIRGLTKDMECVMCLSEETSAVFLPCAHQVLCESCNDIHKSKGMEECPSCRTPINRRVNARYVRPYF